MARKTRLFDLPEIDAAALAAWEASQEGVLNPFELEMQGKLKPSGLFGSAEPLDGKSGSAEPLDGKSDSPVVVVAPPVVAILVRVKRLADGETFDVSFPLRADVCLQGSYWLPGIVASEAESPVGVTLDAFALECIAYAINEGPCRSGTASNLDHEADDDQFFWRLLNPEALAWRAGEWLADVREPTRD